jgi:hypothetical protein
MIINNKEKKEFYGNELKILLNYFFKKQITTK